MCVRERERERGGGGGGGGERGWGRSNVPQNSPTVLCEPTFRPPIKNSWIRPCKCWREVGWNKSRLLRKMHLKFLKTID